ncbi:hypothetical protein XCR_1376 [Xanthomonas campestris pv. raphani 756C]|nr:hypothetical protein XCR_1376 [Xanthomonas campestris pv. raphani 756C]
MYCPSRFRVNPQAGLLPQAKIAQWNGSSGRHRRSVTLAFGAIALT